MAHVADDSAEGDGFAIQFPHVVIRLCILTTLLELLACKRTQEKSLDGLAKGSPSRLTPTLCWEMCRLLFRTDYE